MAGRAPLNPLGGEWPGVTRTDYERIASRYDDDRQHSRIHPDDVLMRLCEGGARVRMLDVGCGTGRFLAVQIGHFKDRGLTGIGIDLSSAMLASARGKMPTASLVRARAEALPFHAAAFDYVFSGWAFHHFVDKRAALEEIARVLRPAGRLRLRNMEPWSMPGWWVYRLFEGTWEGDHHRFWRVERLTEDLQRLGFAVETNIERVTTPSPARDVLSRAEARVISQLAILDDARYRDGMVRLRARASADPASTIDTESATVTLTATRRPR